MREPKEYKYIAAWGRELGLFSYYIVNEQHKAAEQNAPLTAIYYDDRAKHWVTFDEIRSEERKASIQRRIEIMERKYGAV
jgi:hypothetical protein